MLRRYFRPFINSPIRNLFAAVVLLTGLTGISVSANADPDDADANRAPGCKREVWNALKAKAAAQVAYDTAVTRALIDKPDSVLALSCFDKAAWLSAKKGGDIFGGDFTDELGGIMNLTPIPSGERFTCRNLRELWEEVQQGVSTGVPYATFQDMVSGNSPAPDDDAHRDFNAGWTAATPVFSDLRTKFIALTRPRDQDELDFSSAQTSCEVLRVVNPDIDCGSENSP